jgi:hypothetical protein
MNEFLSNAPNPVILIFIVSTMLSCGLSLTVGQIFGPFRNVRIAISVVVLYYCPLFGCRYFETYWY